MTLICLGTSLIALIAALCELENERAQRDRQAQLWQDQHGLLPEGLGGTPWTRKQCGL